MRDLKSSTGRIEDFQAHEFFDNVRGYEHSAHGFVAVAPFCIRPVIDDTNYCRVVLKKRAQRQGQDMRFTGCGDKHHDPVFADTVLHVGRYTYRYGRRSHIAPCG